MKIKKIWYHVLMKKLFLTLCLSLVTLSASAYSTEASVFLEKQYKDRDGNKSCIVVKKEHTEEYMQKIGDKTIHAITYGHGYMKLKGERKCRISYICLLDNNCQPIWGYVIPR